MPDVPGHMRLHRLLEPNVFKCCGVIPLAKDRRFTSIRVTMTYPGGDTFPFELGEYAL